MICKLKIKLFAALLFFVSINITIALSEEKDMPVRSALVSNTFSGFKTDTNYCYNITFPAKGYYELRTEFSSEKLRVDAKKEDRISYANIYNADTVKFQATIYMGKDIVYQSENKFVCSLNGVYSIFYIYTSKSKIPVGTPLQLKVKIISMDCKFSYDDVQFYVGLHQAGFLR